MYLAHVRAIITGVHSNRPPPPPLPSRQQQLQRETNVINNEQFCMRRNGWSSTSWTIFNSQASRAPTFYFSNRKWHKILTKMYSYCHDLDNLCWTRNCSYDLILMRCMNNLCGLSCAICLKPCKKWKKSTKEISQKKCFSCVCLHAVGALTTIRGICINLILIRLNSKYVCGGACQWCLRVWMTRIWSTEAQLWARCK